MQPLQTDPSYIWPALGVLNNRIKGIVFAIETQSYYSVARAYQLQRVAVQSNMAILRHPVLDLKSDSPPYAAYIASSVAHKSLKE